MVCYGHASREYHAKGVKPPMASKPTLVSRPHTHISMARPYHSKEIEDAVISVIRSQRLVCGPVVASFENELASYLGANHVVAVSSGTAALHLAFMAYDLKPGDEVITTAFSFASSTNAILYCGAKPVFADIDPRTYNISPASIEALVTSRTVGIEPVHLYGQPAEMDEIRRIASKYGLWIVEDAAQAIGAQYKGEKIGGSRSGTAACFSTYCTKNLHTMEGGFIAVENDRMAERLKMIRNIGQNGKYNHVHFGFNYRMTEVQAAIGRAQIPILDKLTAKRQENASRLTRMLQGLPGLVTPYSPPYVKHVYHQYTILVDPDEAGFTRDDLSRELAAAGIETSVHYPTPIYLQPYFKQAVSGILGQEHLDDYRKGVCPVTEKVSNMILSLPVHPGLSRSDIEYIGEAIIKCFSEHGKNIEGFQYAMSNRKALDSF